MQQLIRITSTPIEYKMEIEPSRLQMKQAQNPSADIQQTPAKINLQSQNIQVRLDTMDMRRSIGFRTNNDRALEGAQLGRDAAVNFSHEQNRYGKAVSQIEDGIKIADIVRQKTLQQPESYTAFLPSQGPSISWVPNSLDKKYQGGNLNIDWKTAKNMMEYVPGKFHMNITQYPKVDIEYIGSPIYFPKSADPNYNPPIK